METLVLLWLLFAAVSLFIFKSAGLFHKREPRDYKKMTEKQLIAALKEDHGVETRISGLKDTKLILLKLLDGKR